MCPDNIELNLESVICDLIENKGVSVFYVGCNGAFDRMATAVLKRLYKKYNGIEYYTVLESVPSEKDCVDSEHNLLPCDIELVHPRFAIDKRNRWMVDQAQFIVSYTTNTFGGAFKFSELARRKGKKVINIADMVL